MKLPPRRTLGRTAGEYLLAAHVERAEWARAAMDRASLYRRLESHESVRICRKYARQHAEKAREYWRRYNEEANR